MFLRETGYGTALSTGCREQSAGVHGISECHRTTSPKRRRYWHRDPQALLSSARGMDRKGGFASIRPPFLRCGAHRSPRVAHRWCCLVGSGRARDCSLPRLGPDGGASANPARSADARSDGR